jgi:hypothetical protein
MTAGRIPTKQGANNGFHGRSIERRWRQALKVRRPRGQLWRARLRRHVQQSRVCRQHSRSQGRLSQVRREGPSARAAPWKHISKGRGAVTFLARHLDKSEWPNAKFGGDEPEDPWTQIIEIPLRHKESGESYIFTASSKTALAAAKDFLDHCRRLPEAHEPLVRLCITSFKSKFGMVKKPLLSIIGKVPMEGEDDGNPFDDEVPFK